jgi:hypothetical protein
MKEANRNTEPVTELKIGYGRVSAVDQGLSPHPTGLSRWASTRNASALTTG